MVLGREHPADAAAGAVGLEQEPPGCRRERAAREIAPAVPARIIRVGRGSAREADVLHQFVAVVAHAVGALRLVAIRQAARSAISFFVSAIALAGLRPL